MLLKCNITRRGRAARFMIGLLALLPAMSVVLSQQTISLRIAAGLAGGLFAIFEAARGWCVAVYTLEKVRSGATKNRILKLVLGST